MAERGRGKFDWRSRRRTTRCRCFAQPYGASCRRRGFVPLGPPRVPGLPGELEPSTGCRNINCGGKDHERRCPSILRLAEEVRQQRTAQLRTGRPSGSWKVLCGESKVRHERSPTCKRYRRQRMVATDHESGRFPTGPELTTHRYSDPFGVIPELGRNADLRRPKVGQLCGPNSSLPATVPTRQRR